MAKIGLKERKTPMKCPGKDNGIIASARSICAYAALGTSLEILLLIRGRKAKKARIAAEISNTAAI